ncbi:DUF5750 family protein [Methanobrevibacter sp.]|uniref:DUF5750 family protein n=1 Tax=Methanobrevibacter sp. TaxID=66852 RepID=UPI0026DEFD03|nr:DUF5750 family protein [Methanobrevibacter sp.]MDO5822963.1 hypothetical protein [Methanobrevibacter sp.]
MIVKISDYGGQNNSKFIEYEVSGLFPNQIKFLADNLNEETSVNEEGLIIKMYFEDRLYPFQSEVSKFRLNDFIAREEIEMTLFLSSFLEDM